MSYGVQDLLDRYTTPFHVEPGNHTPANPVGGGMWVESDAEETYLFVEAHTSNDDFNISTGDHRVAVPQGHTVEVLSGPSLTITETGETVEVMKPNGQTTVLSYWSLPQVGTYDLRIRTG